MLLTVLLSLFTSPPDSLQMCEEAVQYFENYAAKLSKSTVIRGEAVYSDSSAYHLPVNWTCQFEIDPHHAENYRYEFNDLIVFGGSDTVYAFDKVKKVYLKYPRYFEFQDAVWRERDDYDRIMGITQKLNLESIEKRTLSICKQMDRCESDGHFFSMFIKLKGESENTSGVTVEKFDIEQGVLVHEFFSASVFSIKLYHKVWLNHLDFSANTEKDWTSERKALAQKYPVRTVLDSAYYNPFYEGLAIDLKSWFNGTKYQSEIDSLTGDDLVIIDFWYSTCGPCILSLKSLTQLYPSLPEEVHVFALNTLDSTSSTDGAGEFQEWFDQRNIHLPTIFVRDRPIPELPGYPYTIFIRNGVIVQILQGMTTDQKNYMKSLIEEEIGKPIE